MAVWAPPRTEAPAMGAELDLANNMSAKMGCFGDPAHGYYSPSVDERSVDGYQDQGFLRESNIFS